LTYSYCSGYTTALASCSTNPQSNVLCPGYNPNPQTNTASNTGQSTTTVSTSQPSTTVTSDGRVSTGVAIVSDSNVNQVITRQSTSTDAAATSAPVNVVRQEAPAPQNTTAAVAAKQEQKQEQKAEQKQEQKTDDKSSGTQTAQSSQSSSDSKPSAPTARQEIQAKREAAAKAEAVEKGKNLAGEMGKAADMESQKQIQNVVIQAMGYTPGFDAYNRQIIVEQPFYKPYTIYGGQKNIDNPAGRRFMTGSDRLHTEMVDAQYNRGN